MSNNTTSGTTPSSKLNKDGSARQERRSPLAQSIDDAAMGIAKAQFNKDKFVAKAESFTRQAQEAIDESKTHDALILALTENHAVLVAMSKDLVKRGIAV